MCCEIRNTDGHIVVALTGDIRVKEATEVRERLFPELTKGIASLIFDLNLVTELDSSGFGLLLAAQKIAYEQQAEITFLHMDEKLLSRCRLAGIKL